MQLCNKPELNCYKKQYAFIFLHVTNLLQQQSFLVIFGKVVGGERALNPRSYNNTLIHHVEKETRFKNVLQCSSSTDQSSHIALT